MTGYFLIIKEKNTPWGAVKGQKGQKKGNPDINGITPLLNKHFFL
jgi:hypothetical protein